MIKIKQVNFSYSGDKLGGLHGIDLHIRPGECILLCGKSGCGKTTVTKLLNGLIPHFDCGDLDGETTVDGMAVADTPMYRLSQKVGSVFQNPKSQFFNIDSESELAFGLENNGIDPIIIRARVETTARELNIEHLRHRNIFSMSGGEKQSLAFASVYAMNPDVYVLDEPSANLDRNATLTLEKELKHIKTQGKTIIVAEHRLYYLPDLIDRAILIADGKIEREFSRNEFLSLSDKERCRMGLRTLQWKNPPYKIAGSGEGELQVKNLAYAYKKNTVFDNISFSISSGEIVGIIGKNGAGKTTLMRCIAGLLKERSGEILFHGKPMSKKERNAACYMIMQDVNHQLFGESVWNECELSADVEMQAGEIERALKEFDLLECRDKHPMALSGGQKQRLAIVTGIVAGKKILIFDEPTSGLDYDHMCVVSQTMKALAQRGHIIFVVTHDMEFLELTCDQAIEINGDESSRR
ncbi:energy-coupling factor ABC transporter ATP-binding protein [Lachnospiraceae bacterium 54-53]